MMCLLAMMMAGTVMKAQEITNTLNPSRNWISYQDYHHSSVTTTFLFTI